MKRLSIISSICILAFITSINAHGAKTPCKLTKGDASYVKATIEFTTENKVEATVYQNSEDGFTNVFDVELFKSSTQPEIFSIDDELLPATYNIKTGDLTLFNKTEVDAIFNCK